MPFYLTAIDHIPILSAYDRLPGPDDDNKKTYALTNLFDVAFFLPLGVKQVPFRVGELKGFINAIAGRSAFPDLARDAMNTIFDSTLSAVLDAGMFARIRNFLSSSTTSMIADSRWDTTGKRQLVKELELRQRFYLRIYPWHIKKNK